MADRSKDRRRPGTGKNEGEAGSREDRLRAALRANLARRKAQARARSDRNVPETGSGETERGKDTGGDDS
ncbi:hypothetical protein [Paracoccus saliphilus]|uniref:Uncharacterized protein n=1 Tax=Paracoccus saliphilus TaxID=405559 RepID=A0AA46A5F5_9RHOB|nr:hypothetical protein [Paracoccus saliphilus]WCR04282.1 hypothetical protein JHX88_05995 [Paracoccus saliphilus]SIS80064.1 hypothetical protein SAMN05421772_10588 [Paracoccus saliphilus]